MKHLMLSDEVDSWVEQPSVLELMPAAPPLGLLDRQQEVRWWPRREGRRRRCRSCRRGET